MTLLQRYILRELIGPIVLSVLFFSLLMMLRQLFSYAELLLEAGVGLSTFLEFVGIIMVTLMIVTVPMAVLLGCLIGVGRLTAENEILAMRVAGLSLPRLFTPVFVLATLGSIILMYCGFTVIPSMARGLKERQQELAFELFMRLEAGRQYDDLETANTEIALFFKERLPRQPGDPEYSLRMKNVSLRVEGEGDDITGARIAPGSTPAREAGERETRETLIFAEQGILQGDLAARSISMTLENGIIFPLNFVQIRDSDGLVIDQFRRNPEREVKLQFGRMTQSFSPNVDETLIDSDPRIMTFAELQSATSVAPEGPLYQNERRKRLNTSWRLYLSARNELYQRITLPFSLLAFVLIAVPLAVELRPRAKTFSFLIAIALLALYYVMLTTASAIGMSNSPLTFAAFMAPNAIIGGIGILLFWRVQR